jgi:hypothetical protein
MHETVKNHYLSIIVFFFMSCEMLQKLQAEEDIAN